MDIRVVHSGTSLSGFCVVLKIPVQLIPRSMFTGILKDDEEDEYEMVDDNGHATKDKGASNNKKLTIKSILRCILAGPLHIYVKVERQQLSVTGILLAACMLYGTYMAVKSISSGGMKANNS